MRLEPGEGVIFDEGEIVWIDDLQQFGTVEGIAENGADSCLVCHLPDEPSEKCWAAVPIERVSRLGVEN